jgi:hypothetical protein
MRGILALSVGGANELNYHENKFLKLFLRGSHDREPREI